MAGPTCYFVSCDGTFRACSDRDGTVLWSWRSKEGRAVHSCTIVTTRANARLRRIHDRMPVILGPGGYAPWLDPDAHS